LALGVERAIGKRDQIVSGDIAMAILTPLPQSIQQRRRSMPQGPHVICTQGCPAV